MEERRKFIFALEFSGVKTITSFIRARQLTFTLTKCGSEREKQRKRQKLSRKEIIYGKEIEVSMENKLRFVREETTLARTLHSQSQQHQTTENI